MGKLDLASLHAILEGAILAPSADNQHRVRFGLAGDTVSIRSTAVLPPAGGYKRVLALLSLGALSENLAIAASRFGMRGEPVLFPDPSEPDLVVRVRLEPDRATPDPLWEMIPLRHTNRRVRFHGPGMTAAERGELEAAVRAYPACQLSWLDQPQQRRQALRLMRRAETERFCNRVLHEELFSAIRFDAGWGNAAPEGLPPGALGVEPPLRPFFSLLRHWPVMRAANLLGAHRMLGWRSCDLPCRLAPHLGVLAVKKLDEQSVFDSGRAFQRLWLVATRHGRVLQPMPASALYALDGARAEGIPLPLQRALAAGWKASLGEVWPVMVFRMGKAKRQSVDSARLSLEHYL